MINRLWIVAENREFDRPDQHFRLVRAQSERRAWELFVEQSNFSDWYSPDRDDYVVYQIEETGFEGLISLDSSRVCGNNRV